MKSRKLAKISRFDHFWSLIDTFYSFKLNVNGVIANIWVTSLLGCLSHNLSNIWKIVSRSLKGYLSSSRKKLFGCHMIMGTTGSEKKLFSLNCVIVICLKALVVFTFKFVLLLTFFLANIHELISFDRHK